MTHRTTSKRSYHGATSRSATHQRRNWPRVAIHARNLLSSLTSLSPRFLNTKSCEIYQSPSKIKNIETLFLPSNQAMLSSSAAKTSMICGQSLTFILSSFHLNSVIIWGFFVGFFNVLIFCLFIARLVYLEQSFPPHPLLCLR